MDESPDLRESRNRRGEMFIDPRKRFPLEQEASLELPLGYTPEVVLPSRIAVFLHAFHLDLLPEVRAYLEHIPVPADLFITTDTGPKHWEINRCFASWLGGQVTVAVVPNRGRDIAPKLYGFPRAHDDYEFVLHLHTKQSPHDDRLSSWRGYLYETLLGSPDAVRGIFAAFAACPSLGMLAPQHVDELRPWIRWAVNHRLAEGLALRLGFPLPMNAPLDFPSGSMFWARTAALKPLLDLHLGFYDFPAESGQTDGTLAHAIERLFFLACEEAGFSWMKITARDQLHDQSTTIAVNGPDGLVRFVGRHALRLTAMREVERLGREQPLISSAPSKPKRVTHVLWRRAMGMRAAVPEGWIFVVVLRGPAAGDTKLAEALRQELSGQAATIVVNARLSRADALELGFGRSATLVLTIDQPGIVLPGSVDAMARMAVAHGGCALIEAAEVPNLEPKLVDVANLTTSWAGGPMVAITAQAYRQVGNFDDRLDGRAAEIDLSRRAQALGIAVLHCPEAQVFPAHCGIETETAPGNEDADTRRGLVRIATARPDDGPPMRFAALETDRAPSRLT